MHDAKLLSLIIPCYNEAANLPHLLSRCDAVCNARQKIEIVLVDNGSTDNSAAALAELLPAHPGCRSVRVEKNQGYGYGIIFGLRAAKGNYLAWTHADMQTDPQDILAGMALLEQSPTPEKLFLKGSRYGRPLGDVIFTVGMSIFETLLLGARLWDINAQPTIFSREFFEGWRNPPDDFALDLYAYHRARKAGYTVARYPVRFGERLHGQSHWNVNWAAKWKFIRRTIDFSWALRRGVYR